MKKLPHPAFTASIAVIAISAGLLFPTAALAAADVPTAAAAAVPTAAPAAMPTTAPSVASTEVPGVLAQAVIFSAPPFDRNDIISDGNMLAASCMSVRGIQAFLNGRPGVLKNYRAPDHNGAAKSAAQMIYEAAHAWGISPKVILVTLQKEESLITMTSPSPTRLAWAMGCGYTDGGPLPGYAGFGNQIWRGTKTLAHRRSGWTAGAKLSIDGTSIAPVNASTYSLYVYTPHFGGNSSFWNLYWGYFGNPLTVPGSLPRPALSPGSPLRNVGFTISGRVDTVVETTSPVKLTIWRLVGRTYRSNAVARTTLEPGATSYRTKVSLQTPGDYAMSGSHIDDKGFGLSRSACRLFVVR